jgi:hypothetical protein
LAKPLTELMKKGKEWQWTDLEEEIFEILKREAN